MIEFLLLETNTAFGIAFITVLLIAMMEMAGLLVGFSLSELFDQLISGSVDSASMHGGFSTLLGWFFLNKLPFMIWLVLFLSSFSISGYSANFIAIKSIDHTLPEIISLPITLIASCCFIRLAGNRFSALVGQKESSAVSSDSFSGKIASITLGKATLNNPAEAVLIDQYQQKHYIMVMPCSVQESFQQGDDVVLVEKQQSFWTAIKFNHKTQH